VEALVTRGAAVAVTTHYERLKELAATDERMENASVGFDFGRMLPTFTLTQGVPGASSALAVARRFGLPDQVVARAQALVGHAARRREQLLAELERERDALKRAKEHAEAHLEQAQQAAAAAQQERRRAREEERQRLVAESSALMAEVRTARQQLRAINAPQNPRDGATKHTGKAARKAQRQIDQAAHLVALGGPLAQATAPAAVTAGPPLNDVKAGDSVYLPKLKQHATVTAIVGKHAQVQAGAFPLKVPLDQLRAGAAPAAKQKRPAKLRKPKPRQQQASALALRTSSNTCDLRGMRVDEALATVERFLDEQLRSGETTSFVLHGHGTGALKTAVRQHLLEHQVVLWSRPASQREGGDALTVVALR
ncbi:MAG TPA: endonuclease MutS2, partial [Sorangium sp.]|nr:endonuclease MutS2 [Sorangium sp.]